MTNSTMAWWTSAEWKADTMVGLLACRDLPIPGMG